MSTVSVEIFRGVLQWPGSPCRTAGPGNFTAFSELSSSSQSIHGQCPAWSQRVISACLLSMLPPCSPRRCKRPRTACNAVFFKRTTALNPNGPLPDGGTWVWESPGHCGACGLSAGPTTAPLSSIEIECPNRGETGSQRGGAWNGACPGPAPPETGTQAHTGPTACSTAGPGCGPAGPSPPTTHTGLNNASPFIQSGSGRSIFSAAPFLLLLGQRIPEGESIAVPTPG